jgi:CrcB protein
VSRFIDARARWEDPRVAGTLLHAAELWQGPAVSDAKMLLWIFASGGAGACLRAVLTGVVDARLAASLPHAGTLAVNLVGCFVIGVLTVVLAPGPMRTVAMVGLLGGFTTYSAFALLGWELARDGRIGMALAQIAAHVVLGSAFVGLGIWLGRALR